MKNIAKIGLAALIVILTGCATTQQPYDYTNFKVSNPKSILILPPKNNSLDTKALYGFYSTTQRPLAESGYYVLPISLVDETFKNNGLTVPEDIHQVDKAKLHEIFGADAALYVTISQYGTKYMVLGSASIVTASATLVDLRNGATLWQGSATASSEEGQNNQGGLAVMLVTALVKQVIGTAIDQSHQISKMTNARMLTAGMPNGVLYGPRHPLYGK
ncbi:MAG: hypothetical protein K0S28_1486 [Paucimonas sp.]|nr:hypothetical protein [Paucimonas sp.]